MSGGSMGATPQDPQNTERAERDLSLEMENSEALKDMLKELRDMNIHLQIITGERL